MGYNLFRELWVLKNANPHSTRKVVPLHYAWTLHWELLVDCGFLDKNDKNLQRKESTNVTRDGPEVLAY